MNPEVNSLIRNLESGDPALVRVALQKLGKLGDPAALPAIEKLLSIEEDMIGFFARRAHQKLTSGGAPLGGAPSGGAPSGGAPPLRHAASASRPAPIERPVPPDRPATVPRPPAEVARPASPPEPDFDDSDFVETVESADENGDFDEFLKPPKTGSGRRYDEIAEEASAEQDEEDSPLNSLRAAQPFSFDEDEEEPVARSAADYDAIEEDDDDMAALLQAQGRGRPRYSAPPDEEEDETPVPVSGTTGSGAYDLGVDEDPYADEDLMLLLGKGGPAKAQAGPTAAPEAADDEESPYDAGSYSVDAYDIGTNIMDEIEADASSVSEGNPFEKLLGNSWDEMMNDAGADIEVIGDDAPVLPSGGGKKGAPSSAGPVGAGVYDLDDDQNPDVYGTGDDAEGEENPFVPQSNIFGVPKAGPFAQEVDPDVKRQPAVAAPSRTDAVREDGMPEWWKPQGEPEEDNPDYKGKPYVPTFGKGRPSDDDRSKPGKKPFRK